ncbi:transposase [Streptosporangium sp. NPDC002721]|uniref:transposase n=1 Tax=Streptosporangium sp. NPDC002721 TaxID=3366188 RepID=UPI0036BC1C47
MSDGQPQRAPRRFPFKGPRAGYPPTGHADIPISAVPAPSARTGPGLTGDRAPRTPGRPAIVYVVRTGCFRRGLPTGFPPWQTVYRHFVCWEDQGVTQQIMDVPRRRVRKESVRGPAARPSLRPRCRTPPTAYRRLARDHEHRPPTGEAMIRWASPTDTSPPNQMITTRTRGR